MNAKKSKTPLFPQQPIVDGQFVPNKIVRFLLDSGANNMNTLALMNFSDADRAQFAQLIGYSLNGYNELSYTENFPILVEDQEKNDLRDAHRYKLVAQQMLRKNIDEMSVLLDTLNSDLESLENPKDQ